MLPKEDENRSVQDVMIQRVTTSENVAVVVGLAQTIWHEHFPSVISHDQIDYMLGRFLSHRVISAQISEDYQYYLIGDPESPVGFMAVVPQDGGLHISKLYVLKEVRGRGLSREALVFLEDICQREGYARLWLRVNSHNELAIAVYKRLGFEVCDTLVQDIGAGFVMDDYVMDKSL
jgi:diamine N-acetyltransferase